MMSIFDYFTRRNRQTAVPVSPAEQPIPEDEKKYYQPDEYYTKKRFQGTPFASDVITFEERKRTAFPSSRGLYPAEILLLQYCAYGMYPHPQNGYPRFWWFEYGIRNVGAVLSDLEKRGYIQYVSADESLPRLTAPQLKSLLSSFGVVAKGKKADLLNAVRTNISLTDLEGAVTERKYRLTASGEAELQENAYVPYMHNRPHKTLVEDPANPESFNVWVINNLLGQESNANWKEVCDRRESDLETLWQSRSQHNSPSSTCRKQDE